MQRELLSFASSLTFKSQLRCLSTSSCLCGRRTRVPYDRRYPMNAKDVAAHKPGGNRQLSREMGKNKNYRWLPQFPTIPNNRTGRGVDKIIPEMIPEFVVPDLKDFTLKPYVSYNVTEVTQSEFTAKDLFDAMYSKEIIEDFQAGKITEDYVKDKFSKSSDD